MTPQPFMAVGNRGTRRVFQSRKNASSQSRGSPARAKVVRQIRRNRYSTGRGGMWRYISQA